MMIKMTETRLKSIISVKETLIKTGYFRSGGAFIGLHTSGIKIDVCLIRGDILDLPTNLSRGARAIYSHR